MQANLAAAEDGRRAVQSELDSLRGSLRSRREELDEATGKAREEIRRATEARTVAREDAERSGVVRDELLRREEELSARSLSLKEERRQIDRERRALDQERTSLSEQLADLEARETDLTDSAELLGTERVQVEAIRLAAQEANERLEEDRNELRTVQDHLLKEQARQDMLDSILHEREKKIEHFEEELLRREQHLTKRGEEADSERSRLERVEGDLVARDLNMASAAASLESERAALRKEREEASDREGAIRKESKALDLRIDSVKNRETEIDKRSDTLRELADRVGHDTDILRKEKEIIAKEQASINKEWSDLERREQTLATQNDLFVRRQEEVNHAIKEARLEGKKEQDRLSTLEKRLNGRQSQLDQAKILLRDRESACSTREQELSLKESGLKQTIQLNNERVDAYRAQLKEVLFIRTEEEARLRGAEAKREEEEKKIQKLAADSKKARACIKTKLEEARSELGFLHAEIEELREHRISSQEELKRAVYECKKAKDNLDSVQNDVCMTSEVLSDKKAALAELLDQIKKERDSWNMEKAQGESAIKAKHMEMVEEFNLQSQQLAKRSEEFESARRAAEKSEESLQRGESELHADLARASSETAKLKNTIEELRVSYKIEQKRNDDLALQIQQQRDTHQITIQKLREEMVTESVVELEKAQRTFFQKTESWEIEKRSLADEAALVLEDFDMATKRFELEKSALIEARLRLEKDLAAKKERIFFLEDTAARDHSIYEESLAKIQKQTEEEITLTKAAELQQRERALELTKTIEEMSTSAEEERSKLEQREEALRGKNKVLSNELEGLRGNEGKVTALEAALLVKERQAELEIREVRGLHESKQLELEGERGRLEEAQKELEDQKVRVEEQKRELDRREQSNHDAQGCMQQLALRLKVKDEELTHARVLVDERVAKCEQWDDQLASWQQELDLLTNALNQREKEIDAKEAFISERHSREERST